MVGKLGLTSDERQLKRRQYTRDNRELWKQLGFRMMSAPIHNDDRAEVLAELEVKRCLRLAKQAEDKDVGISSLVQIGRRNLTPVPKSSQMREFAKSCGGLDNQPDIDYAIDNALKAAEKFRNCRANLNNTSDDTVKQRLFAKEVAYGNLAASWFKLAELRATLGETETVFGEQDG